MTEGISYKKCTYNEEERKMRKKIAEYTVSDRKESKN